MMAQEPNTHPTDEAIADYLRGRLSRPERSQLAGHLDTCGDCRQTATDLEALLVGLEAETESHVPEQALEQFQSGMTLRAEVASVSGWSQETVEIHISYCEQCRDELALLREIDAETQHDSALNRRPVPSPALSQGKRRRIIRAPILIPLAAAAVLTAFLLSQFWPVSIRRDWATVDPAVDKGKLIAMTTRSTGDSPSTQYTSAAEAALSSFREALVFDQGEFSFREQSKTDSVGVTTVVKLVDASGNIVGAVEGYLPNTLDPERDNLEVWILTLPSRQLDRLPTRSLADEVVWNVANGPTGCITWTFRSGSGFSTVQTRTFEYGR